MAVAVCLVVAASVYAVGTDELTIAATSAGGYELQIALNNTSEYYLANIDISVKGENSGGIKVKSFGFSGTGSDSTRMIAPGESVSAYANIDAASVTDAPSKNNQSQVNPVQTDPPKNNNNSQGQPSPSGGASANVGGYDDTPAQNVVGNGEYNNSNADPATEAPSGDGEDTAESGAESEVSDDGTGEETSIHTIHSMAPGESVTLYTSLAGGSESEPVKVMPAEEIPPYTIWIVLGAIVVLGVAAFIVIKIKKNKDAGKDIANVIVIALILTGLVSADVSVVYADSIKDPVSGHVEQTVSIGGKGNIIISADYTVVPAAVTEPLKSARKAQPGDECNTPQVNERRLTEGSGPLTGHGIYIGQNDFMFYGAALDDYRGQTVMSNARMKKLSDMMNQRDAWAKENGIKLYLVIAPNKSSVYPEYVPDSITAASTTNADAVVQHLAQNSSVEVIDLRQPLINAKGEYGDTLFYKYDTHWNNNGGFVGYSEIMRRVNEDVADAYTLNKGDFNVTDYETYMKDMAYYLGYYSKYTDYGPVYTLKSGMTATIGEKESDGFWGQFRFCARWKDGYSDALKYITYENTYNEGAPSLYVYRDSFAVSLVHFLKDSFHNSVFDWSYDFNKQEILASGADVVIMEVVEKQLAEFTNSRTFS